MNKIQKYIGLAFIIIGIIPVSIGYFTMFSSSYVLGKESYGRFEQQFIYPTIGVTLIVIGIIILFYNQIYKKVKPDLTVRVVR
jgi:multisubunit Na+/H+ antiporter MnhG subunit